MAGAAARPRVLLDGALVERRREYADEVLLVTADDRAYPVFPAQGRPAGEGGILTAG